MTNTLKKLFITIFTCILIMTVFIPVYANEIMPLYNNTTTTSGAFNIDSNGLASIRYQYVGIPDVTTKAVVTSYLQKKTLGLFWEGVKNFVSL